MTYEYDVWRAATDGATSSDPYCLATDGFLCSRGRFIVSPGPSVGLRRQDREGRDMRDIAEIVSILARSRLV